MNDLRQEGRIVVRPAGQREIVYFDPTTDKQIEEEVDMFKVEQVDGDVGDPYLEYLGFRRTYVRNLTCLNLLEIKLLRSQGVVVEGAPED